MFRQAIRTMVAIGTTTVLAWQISPASADTPAPVETPSVSTLFSFETGVQGWSVGAHDSVATRSTLNASEGENSLKVYTPLEDGDWIGSQFQPPLDITAGTSISFDFTAGVGGTVTNLALQTGDEWAWCAGPDWTWVNGKETKRITVTIDSLTCGEGQTLKPAHVQKMLIFFKAGTHYIDNVSIDADVTLPPETVKPTPAGLTEISDFGPNPTNIRMFLHVPARLDPHPGVLVVNHWCSGDGIDAYSNTDFRTLADRFGFLVIYPSVTNGDKCWDVASPKTLQHDGGSDTTGIASMVTYILNEYDADPKQVFSTGVSSGAMMTNVLLATYPDLFAGGAAFAGVPHSCFAGPSRWSTACATGQLTRTAEEWGDLARAAFPTYDGPLPRMQLWHGEDDTVLHYNNFAEEIKQWTDVHGLSQTPTSVDTPRDGWTRTRYADEKGVVQVEAISLAATGHDLLKNGMAAEAIAFFGLDS